MRVTAQAKKEQVIAELVAARRSILDAATALPPEKQDETFLGVWSVKDLLAHLVGWDFANIEATQAIQVGRLPAFYAHYNRDWQTFNAGLVAEYKRDRFADLLALVEDSHRQLVEYLRAVPADEFDRDVGLRAKGWKVTIARLMQVEAKDERTHHAQIQEFTGAQRAS